MSPKRLISFVCDEILETSSASFRNIPIPLNLLVFLLIEFPFQATVRRDRNLPHNIFLCTVLVLIGPIRRYTAHHLHPATANVKRMFIGNCLAHIYLSDDGNCDKDQPSVSSSHVMLFPFARPSHFSFVFPLTSDNVKCYQSVNERAKHNSFLLSSSATNQ